LLRLNEHQNSKFVYVTAAQSVGVLADTFVTLLFAESVSGRRLMLATFLA
jgi:hypothetical protein